MFALEEVPGLYGGIRLEERVLQRIWSEVAFRTEGMKTADDRKLEIISPGDWNLSEEGPDFKNVVIKLDDEEVLGDLEFHFRPEDWKNHQHQVDPSYDRLVLHVSLFPPCDESLRILTSKKRVVPQFVLLPHLYQGLEEYEEDWVLQALNSESLGFPARRPKGIEATIAELAGNRWEQKLNFARRRLDRLGWEKAAHQWLLEGLGYPRNKARMHVLAEVFPLSAWRDGLEVEEIYDRVGGWRLKGMRPRNRPLHRLKQYRDFVAQNPDWPEELRKLAFKVGSPFGLEDRKSLRLFAKRRSWMKEVLAGQFGSSKSDTLAVDVALPLWAAYHGVDCFAYWYHWPCGDLPERVRLYAENWNLKDKGESLANGVGQGLLAKLLLDRRTLSSS